MINVRSRSAITTDFYLKKYHVILTKYLRFIARTNFKAHNLRTCTYDTSRGM